MDRHNRSKLVSPLTVLLLAVSACAPDMAPTTATPPRIPAASDFEAAVARLEQKDPQSPQAMNARLEYADFLLQSERGDCHPRLDVAQTQLDALASRPAVQVVLPLGPARLADGAYRLHAARAACDPPARRDELQQALEAARNAAALYRDALDYQSAAIMQFNVAATLHELGDNDAAIAALEATLALDREFGFRDDAEDNSRLLLGWKKQDDSDEAVAALMKDFPARTAEFKFAWSDSDASVAVTAEDANIVDGKVVHSRGVNLIKRQVRKDERGWAVSYEPGTPAFAMGDWPEKNGDWWLTAYLLTDALQGYPKFAVTQTGDFANVRDASAFGQSLLAEMTARLDGTASGHDKPPSESVAWAHTLKSVFQPQYVEADAEQAYSVETATWIGAKLEQGVWYKMSAPLSLPGLRMGKFLVAHNIEFSYTRQVPCMATAEDPLCAEIVVQATPDPGDLTLAREAVAHSLHVFPEFLRYWSTTSLRLVVKPDTLVPYVADTRRYWYIALDETEKKDTAISSQRVVATSTYK